MLTSRAQIEDNFGKDSVACRNLNLIASYFRLFQWHLSVLYRLAPRQLPGWTTQ